jgi:hypothetical protein
MLEHLSAGERREEILGDLLEDFRTRRSANWFWRQALSACLVSWASALRAHLPLIAFAIVWSMAAPAWCLFWEYADHHVHLLHASSIGPLWILVWAAAWTAINTAFVWLGMLVYSAASNTIGLPLQTEKLRRGLFIAPFVLAVTHVAIFIVTAIYVYSIPGLASQRLASSPVTRLTDLRLLPDLMRIPFFVALLASLWGVVAVSPIRQSDGITDGLATDESSAGAGSIHREPARRFLFLLVVAGSMNALLITILLCRLSDYHPASVESVVLRATALVLVSLLGGISGTWLYWKSPWSLLREQKPFSPALFFLVCAPAWVWAPSWALFSDQLSAAIVPVAVVGTFMLAANLRDALPALMPVDGNVRPSAIAPVHREMFDDSLPTFQTEPYGYLIAIAFYAGFAAIFRGANHAAALFLAASAAVYAWKRPGKEATGGCGQGRLLRRSVVKLIAASLLAILVTAWALLDEVKHRDGALASSSTAEGETNKVGDHNKENGQMVAEFKGAGYESLILWPTPAKQVATAPVLFHRSLLIKGMKKPVSIRFNGEYRYVQPPHKRPGPEAHRANGSPLNIGIESSNSYPVMMDAHQVLASAVLTADCRAIEVDIANSDNVAGTISVALLLSDSSSPRNPALYLEQQPMVSTLPGRFTVKSRPAFETVKFSLPLAALAKRFDEITVMMLPDVEHYFVAPKVAIEGFRLVPR